MVNIQDIAKYTILRLIQNGNTICPLKLQKLLYYMQAWHMVYFGRENTLFTEIPEAWVNGPVYRDVYNTYKHIGIYDQIDLKDIKVKDSYEEIVRIQQKLNLTKDQNEFINAILLYYGTYDHDKLVFLTHSESPWCEARRNLPLWQPSEEKLSLDTMYNYYNDRLKRNRKKHKDLKKEIKV